MGGENKREREKIENVLESESNTRRLVFQMSELAEKFVGFSITCRIFCCHEKLYLKSVFFYIIYNLKKIRGTKVYHFP